MNEGLRNVPDLTVKLMREKHKHLFEQNLVQLEEQTGLQRSHLIHIYTTYIAAFAMQILDKGGKVPNHEEVLLETLQKS